MDLHGPMHALSQNPSALKMNEVHEQRTVLKRSVVDQTVATLIAEQGSG